MCYWYCKSSKKDRKIQTKAQLFLRGERKRRKLYCFHLLPHYLMSLFSFPCAHLSVLLKDYLYRALFVVQI